MKKTIAVLALVLCLAGIAVAKQLTTVQTTSLPTEEAPKIGYLAPSFELKTMDGGSAGISRGKLEKPVILNFWASWCDPCRLEAPYLADLYEKYRQDLEIYGINGTEFDDLDSAKAFVKQYDLQFPILLDQRSEIFKLYQVPGYPTSIFIDMHGVIRDIVIGLPGHVEYEKRLTRLIR